MKNKCLLIAVFACIVMGASAQVTIGSDATPEKAALLDLKSISGSNGGVSTDKGGLMLPRVDIQDVNVLNVFNMPELQDADKQAHTGLTVYNVGTKIDKGIYVWDGATWNKAGSDRKEMDFFYMPSIRIDLSKTQLNLYDEYKKQFSKPVVKSTGAPDSIPYFLNPKDLYYYVSDYDSAVIHIANITADGVMWYAGIGQPVDGTSYVNIVFVVK